jgi:Helix-turn-helix domain
VLQRSFGTKGWQAYASAAPTDALGIKPSSPRDWWTIADVARYLGIKASTVRTYVSRGDMPPPDGRMGNG